MIFSHRTKMFSKRAKMSSDRAMHSCHRAKMFFHRAVMFFVRATKFPDRALSANHRAMDAPADSTPKPAAPAAEASNPAAERLPEGALCYRCRYDLVGRAPGQPCPECGLDVAASWPVWDLRQCHPQCVDQAYSELLGVRSVLACVLVGAGAGALAGLGAPAADAPPIIWSLVVLLLLCCAVAHAAAVPALFGLLLGLRRLRPPATQASGPARRWLVIGVCLAIVLLPAAVVLGLVGLASLVLHIGAMLPWSILVLCAAITPLAMASWAHARAVAQRAGRPRWAWWPMPVIAAPALAATLVPMTAIVAPARFEAIAGVVLVLLASGIAIARQDTGRAMRAVEAVARRGA